MEKQIIRWSYLLGAVCALIAVIIRAVIAAGLWHPIAGVQDGWHMSFYKGALLLFALSIATAAYSWSQSQR
jgi:predicted membrane channel-forming protein YqfA (hemolysin III family)